MNSKRLASTVCLAAIALTGLSSASVALAQVGGISFDRPQCEAIIGDYKYLVFSNSDAARKYAVEVKSVTTDERIGLYDLKLSGTVNGLVMFTGSGITYSRSMELNGSKFIKVKNKADIDVTVECVANAS